MYDITVIIWIVLNRAVFLVLKVVHTAYTATYNCDGPECTTWWPLCTHLAFSSWSITCAMSDLNCMKYCMTKLWFLFNGKSNSSTFTTAFSKSRSWGTFSLFLATNVIILCTWFPLIFMQVVEFPVNTYKVVQRVSCYHKLIIHYTTGIYTYFSQHIKTLIITHTNTKMEVIE